MFNQNVAAVADVRPPAVERDGVRLPQQSRLRDLLLGEGLIAQSACVFTSPFATLDGWPDSAEPGRLASEDMPD